ncbi:MAG: hypothetical protein ACI8P9_004110 [Parasphingorhabdus sp.]|jgi:hypothetical protein
MANYQDYYKEVEEFECDLGIKVGFLESLVKEDDWTFVIKLHALLEIVVTDLLVHAIGKLEIDKEIASLDMSVKLDFGKSLKFVAKEERRFIKELSKLRNFLVHDAKNTSFCFENYVGRMDQNQKKAFCESIGYSFDTYIGPEGRKTEKFQFIGDNPKISIWLNSMFAIAVLYQYREYSRVKNSIQNMALKGIMEKANKRLESPDS